MHWLEKVSLFLQTFNQWADGLLGLSVEPKNLTFLQTSLRGIITFFVALLIVRLADRRFLSSRTAFDAILTFLLASMLARAVNGSSSFFPTLGCGFVLVGLHRVLAYLGRVSKWCGYLFKGKFDLLVKDGQILPEAMRKNDVSLHDLAEDLRLNGNLEDPKEVKAAYIERNGQISVVK